MEEMAFIASSFCFLDSASNFQSNISRGNASEEVQVACVVVGFRRPVLSSAGSCFLPWVDLSQTRHACSTEKQHRARAVDLNVCAVAPHLELVSFHRMLFREPTLDYVSLMCSLKESVRFRVTPR